jgi:hypothetical protein
MKINILTLSFGLMVLGVLAAQNPTDKTTTPKSGESIDFNKARSIFQKQSGGGKLTQEEIHYLERAKAARKEGQGQPKNSRMINGKDKIGLKPLNEMTGQDNYLGQDGGLYGNGKNFPPEAHRKSAQAAISRLKPLNNAGNLDEKGTIGFVSISMSNATQEFSMFKQLADADPSKSKLVKIIDCAQGGQAMAEWVDPKSRPWLEAEKRLSAAAVNPNQVQVAWIKLANKGPNGDLKEHGEKLEKDTLAVIQNAKAKFPNLQLAYLSSRIYGGYSTGALNPEPYAYESAFPVRWLIQRQIKGDETLSFEGTKVLSPVLLWGPYLWADGVTPRQSDKLVYNREDPMSCLSFSRMIRWQNLGSKGKRAAILFPNLG